MKFDVNNEILWEKIEEKIELVELLIEDEDIEIFIDKRIYKAKRGEEYFFSSNAFEMIYDLYSSEQSLVLGVIDFFNSIQSINPFSMELLVKIDEIMYVNRIYFSMFHNNFKIEDENTDYKINIGSEVELANNMGFLYDKVDLLFPMRHLYINKEIYLHKGLSGLISGITVYFKKRDKYITIKNTAFEKVEPFNGEYMLNTSKDLQKQFLKINVNDISTNYGTIFSDSDNIIWNIQGLNTIKINSRNIKKINTVFGVNGISRYHHVVLENDTTLSTYLLNKFNKNKEKLSNLLEKAPNVFKNMNEVIFEKIKDNIKETSEEMFNEIKGLREELDAKYSIIELLNIELIAKQTTSLAGNSKISLINPFGTLETITISGNSFYKYLENHGYINKFHTLKDKYNLQMSNSELKVQITTEIKNKLNRLIELRDIFKGGFRKIGGKYAFISINHNANIIPLIKDGFYVKPINISYDIKEHTDYMPTIFSDTNTKFFPLLKDIFDLFIKDNYISTTIYVKDENSKENLKRLLTYSGSFIKEIDGLDEKSLLSYSNLSFVFITEKPIINKYNKIIGNKYYDGIMYDMKFFGKIVRIVINSDKGIEVTDTDKIKENLFDIVLFKIAVSSKPFLTINALNNALEKK